MIQQNSRSIGTSLCALGGRFIFLLAIVLTPAVIRAAVTGSTGSSLPIDDMQPSAAINYLIRFQGDADRLAEIVPFAGSFAPGGWVLARGQQLAVSQNMDLFDKIDSTYGGDNVATFNLPDLRGRTAIGAGQGPGLTNRALGAKGGVESVALSTNEMPSRNPPLPPGGNTSDAGGGADLTNMQPSLALTYAMKLNAPFPEDPPQGGPVQTPFLGQVQLLARNSLPAGYVEANGQLL